MKTAGLLAFLFSASIGGSMATADVEHRYEDFDRKGPTSPAEVSVVDVGSVGTPLRKAQVDFDRSFSRSKAFHLVVDRQADPSAFGYVVFALGLPESGQAKSVEFDIDLLGMKDGLHGLHVDVSSDGSNFETIGHLYGSTSRTRRHAAFVMGKSPELSDSIFVRIRGFSYDIGEAADFDAVIDNLEVR